MPDNLKVWARRNSELLALEVGRYGIRCSPGARIASAAARRNEMRLMDVSSRVATGLEYSEMRLYDLAMSYSGQLHSRLGKDEPKAYQAFTDTYSPSVYKDIHSLFWELAVLRDVLAEFIAVFCLKRNDATTLSGVLRSLKNTPSNYDMRLPRIPTGEVTELRGPNCPDFNSSATRS